MNIRKLLFYRSLQKNVQLICAFVTKTKVITHRSSFTIYVLLLPALAAAQITFQKNISNTGKLTFGLAAMPDSGYIVAGSSPPPLSCAQLWRIDHSGNTVWGKKICVDTSILADAAAFDHVSAAADGTIRAIFHKRQALSTGGREENVFAAALGPDGTVLWVKKLSTQQKSVAGWWPAFSVDSTGNGWLISAHRL